MKERTGNRNRKRAAITRTLVASLLFLLTIGIASAHAYSIGFGDQAHYFPGWSNGAADDQQDVIGIPDILGGTVSFDATYNLTSISFSFIVGSSSTWANLTAGDLFLDVGGDGRWDFSVGSFGMTGSGPANVYDISVPLNGANGYVMSGADGKWNGYNIRDDHPVAIAPGELGAPYCTAEFEGWRAPGSPTDVVWVSYVFNQGCSINIKDGLIIGWTVNCANDVIYERITVPETGTSILLILGMAGICIFTGRIRKGLRRRHSYRH
ncbi:MAG: hypothetical protein JW884_09495 [Deltaproteobacteria bacterium]|nr:hypothetical protein [Deltaproteobacteria bacterium]